MMSCNDTLISNAPDFLEEWKPKPDGGLFNIFKIKNFLSRHLKFGCLHRGYWYTELIQMEEAIVEVTSNNWC